MVESITALVVFLFLYTGISKYLEYQAFENTLSNSPLLKLAAAPIAAILPGIEILVVILLVREKTRLFGLITTLLLLSVFTCYIIYMVLFSPYLPCSCGGVISKLSWKAHIYFNLFFILITGVAIDRQYRLNREYTPR